MSSELIKVDETGRITAKELYEFLELDRSNYSRWCKTNIEENEFYQEGNDWWGFVTMTNGNETKDYQLTIDFAKHLCMLSRSEKGKQARNYFVEIEKRALQPTFKLPATFAEALRQLASTVEENEQLQQQNALMLPKAQFFDAVADSKDAIPMNDAAKVLAIKGMGRNNLFEFLRSQKVLMNNNRPYQKYIDSGYFRVIEQKYMKNGEEHINFKTLVYQRGLEFIRKLVTKDLAS
jgi:anti-repressor protein